MPHSRADSMSPEREDVLPFIYDTIIIGAGPCGLATAARLRERTPSAIFTDAEHHRYHWIKRHAGTPIKDSKTGQVKPLNNKKTKSSTKNSEPSILVLDSSGDEWMSKWNRLFSLLEISHLRSPMFFHPDPHDRDGLLAYAHSMGQQDECIEIAGCVGKELSKHQMKKRRNARRAGGARGTAAKPTITIDERDRKDYFAPPSTLFQSYCTSIATRYHLSPPKTTIHHTTVTSIDYDHIPSLSPSKLFTIHPSTGGPLHARSVVLAIGAGNAPEIPAPFPPIPGPHACHAFQSGGDAALRKRLRARLPTNVLVVGGGLTSAQVVDRAVRMGVQRVDLVMRGPMKVKPFDVDLSWMGKFRNHEKATFWSADTDEERTHLIATARGGGSIPPRFAKLLHAHIQAGRVHLHTHTTLTSARFDSHARTWAVTATVAAAAGADAEASSSSSSSDAVDLPPIHHVYFATGVASDVQTVPFLATMREKYPIEYHAGLPALTEDLAWREGVPLFVTGKLAGLRLGPGAGNLEGARVGAERVVWGLERMLGLEGGGGGEEDEEEEEDLGAYRFAAGIGSRFERLEVGVEG